MDCVDSSKDRMPEGVEGQKDCEKDAAGGVSESVRSSKREAGADFCDGGDIMAAEQVGDAFAHENLVTLSQSVESGVLVR